MQQLKLRRLFLAVCFITTLAVYERKRTVEREFAGNYHLKNRIAQLNNLQLPLLEDAATREEPMLGRNDSAKNESFCPPMFFKVEGMTACRKWLDCHEIERIAFAKEAKKYPSIGKGYSKQVYRVPWGNSSINFAMSVTGQIRRRKIAMDDTDTRMRTGKMNLLNLQPSPYVIQVIGHCEFPSKTILLAEECRKYGSLDKFVTNQLVLQFSAMQRLEIVIQLIECFVYLHYKSGPPKVHCDLHNPLQALRQFLLTDNARVVLADLDEVPVDDRKNNKTAKCLPEARCAMSDSNFLAPEQRYNKKECKAVEKFEKPSSIKADSWKIPLMSFAILNETFPKDKMASKVKIINQRLAYIHQQCKDKDFTTRASSAWILTEYKKVYSKLRLETKIKSKMPGNTLDY